MLLIGYARALATAGLPRLELVGVAQHIVQRGNNHLPCFLDVADRLCYLRFLREALLASGSDRHAYVLMGNHVHLLMTPAEVGAVLRSMQMPGRSHVDAFNARHRRTGTLWERFAGTRPEHRETAKNLPLACK